MPTLLYFSTRTFIRFNCHRRAQLVPLIYKKLKCLFLEPCHWYFPDLSLSDKNMLLPWHFSKEAFVGNGGDTFVSAGISHLRVTAVGILLKDYSTKKIIHAAIATDAATSYQSFIWQAFWVDQEETPRGITVDFCESIGMRFLRWALAVAELTSVSALWVPRFISNDCDAGHSCVPSAQVVSIWSYFVSGWGL